MSEINTRNSYIVFGQKLNSDNSFSNYVELPAPHALPASNQFLVKAERNANATMMIEQVGRTQYTTEIEWDFLPNKLWWKLNRWLDTVGYVFYVKYFSHTEGIVKIQRFYRGNVSKATPSTTTEIIDGVTVPKYYHDCKISVIDMGESDVVVLKTLEVE